MSMNLNAKSQMNFVSASPQPQDGLMSNRTPMTRRMRGSLRAELLHAVSEGRSQEMTSLLQLRRSGIDAAEEPQSAFPARNGGQKDKKLEVSPKLDMVQKAEAELTKAKAKLDKLNKQYDEMDKETQPQADGYSSAEYQIRLQNLNHAVKEQAQDVKVKQVHLQKLQESQDEVKRQNDKKADAAQKAKEEADKKAKEEAVRKEKELADRRAKAAAQVQPKTFKLIKKPTVQAVEDYNTKVLKKEQFLKKLEWSPKLQTAIQVAIEWIPKQTGRYDVDQFLADHPELGLTQRSGVIDSTLPELRKFFAKQQDGGLEAFDLNDLDKKIEQIKTKAEENKVRDWFKPIPIRFLEQYQLEGGLNMLEEDLKSDLRLHLTIDTNTLRSILKNVLEKKKKALKMPPMKLNFL